MTGKRTPAGPALRTLGDLGALRKQLQEAEQRAQRERALREAQEQARRAAASEFAQAVRDATPLPPSKRHIPLPPTHYVPRPRDETVAAARKTAALAEGRPAPLGAARSAAGASGGVLEETSYRRAGVGIDVTRKLHRGFWPVEDELDLHGQTVDTAHRALGEFLDEALAARKRCVRVIHGKGLGSAAGEPVLKGRVRLWLAGRHAVRAFAQAPVAQGGSGALLVLLES